MTFRACKIAVGDVDIDTERWDIVGRSHNVRFGECNAYGAAQVGIKPVEHIGIFLRDIWQQSEKIEFAKSAVEFVDFQRLGKVDIHIKRDRNVANLGLCVGNSYTESIVGVPVEHSVNHHWQPAGKGVGCIRGRDERVENQLKAIILLRAQLSRNDIDVSRN